MIILRVISGSYKGRKIKTIESYKTRPTADKIKESIFNIIGPYFDGGVCLDLFAGSGNLGIESLSRGMDKCIFIDKNFESFKFIKENIKSLKINEETEVYNTDYKRALKVLSKKNISFDYIFLDPPYKMDVLEDIILFVYEKNLLNNDGKIICEYDTTKTLKEEIHNIKQIRTDNYGRTKVSIYMRK